MLLVVFAIDVNNLNCTCYVLLRSVQQQRLATPSTTKDDVVLSSNDIRQSPRDVDIVDRVASASLHPDVFLHDSPEVLNFARHTAESLPNVRDTDLGELTTLHQSS